jgi:hypothetical protein
MPIEPWTTLQAAIERVPAVSYALAVAGVAAAGAIIVSFLGYGHASVTIIAGVFIAMILMFVFSRMMVDPNPATTLPGIILLYSVIVFFVAFLSFTVTAFAFQWPSAWADFLNISVRPVYLSTQVDRPAVRPDDLSRRLVSFAVKSLADNLKASDNGHFTGATWAWNRDHWEETANGKTMFHDVTERISFDGCNGDRTIKEEDHSLEFFIQDRDCANMMLYFRLNGGGWATFGPISDPK